MEIAPVGSDDDLARLGAWLAEPRIARGLNIKPRQLSAADVRRYVESFDGRTGVIVGIRAGGRLAGISTFDLNLRHRTAQWSLVVGDPAWRGKAALLEMGILSFDWAFGEAGLDKVSCRIAGNKFFLKRLLEEVGIVREGHFRADIVMADGSGRRDEFAYGLLRSEWPEVRARMMALRSTPQTS